MMRVAVFGSSGFVGSEIVRVLSDSGIEVSPVPAPRLRASSRTEEGLRAELSGPFAVEETTRLSEVLAGTDAVINSAGLAEPGSGESDELFGANALLPGVIAAAAEKAGVSLLLQISSAAVHGSAKVLDPQAQPVPESPYGRSKLFGEVLTKSAAKGTRVLVYRPTSVHGVGRAVTEKIAKLAKSRFSSVAAPGTDPTPQVMVEQVAEYVRRLVANPPETDDPIIHPWEGWTTSSFLEYMGDGRQPIRVPRSLARAALAAAKGLGRIHPGIGANARRLEILWFGQGQTGTSL